MQVIKVLIISNIYPSKSLPFAGIFVKNQFEKLSSQMGHDNVEIFYITRTFSNALGSLLKYAIAFIKFTPRLIKKYDIIHVHYFFPFYLLAYFYKIFHPKTKIVVTFHGGDIVKFFNSNFSKSIFHFLSKKVDYTIAVGTGTSQLISDKLKLKVDQIMSAGIDETIFYEEKTEKKFDFIFVAKFIDRKGTHLLIEAIKLLSRKDIRYCFVGSGKYLNDLKDLKKDFDVTIFLNKTQAELRILYNESKFLIMPSLDEPFGLVCTEAMFCGCVPIVSNVGGLAEQVVNDVNGFIIENLTAKGISDILNKSISLSKDKYQNMERNSSSSNKQHSLEIVCQKTEVIYKTLTHPVEIEKN